MHMADALISPQVGGSLWAASAAALAYACRRVRCELEDRGVPLMGVLGAFVFAAQMINFSIPGTGSSGHLGGGTLLAVLLGPNAAFLTMASVLTVQALFFGDGGLLALGCNIANLGLIPCFLVYPLVFPMLAGRAPGPKRFALACVICGVVSLLVGALGVVLETVFSGVSELRLGAFAALMLPIHLAIGLVEGLATAAAAGFLRRARPGLPAAAVSGRRAVASVLAVALLTAGGLSWFSSSRPDGLEWSVARAGRGELSEPDTAVHRLARALEGVLVLLPDYALGSSRESASTAPTEIDPSRSLAGLVGVLLTLAFAGLAGFILRRRAAPAKG